MLGSPESSGYQAQIKQLESESFRGVDVVAGDGSFLAAGEPCTDPWIYYVARRG